MTAWITLVAVTGAFMQEHFAAALGVGTSACFYAGAALEFWRGRSEELRGRTPMIGIVTLYAITLLMLAAQFALAVDYIPVASPGWLGAVQFVGLVYALGVALFLNTMLNSRSEKQYMTAALTDPLTGLANRRAFMDRAQRVLDRPGKNGDPVALLAFDLDWFKRINDTFGHPMGDRILRAFADVLSGLLRSTDLAARIGGEEFVAIVVGADEEGIVAIANRIRDAFQTEALFMEGQKVGATVSVGVATSAAQPCNIVTMLAEADAALYLAKDGGRNRVVVAKDECGKLKLGNVVRIA